MTHTLGVLPRGPRVEATGPSWYQRLTGIYVTCANRPKISRLLTESTLRSSIFDPGSRWTIFLDPESHVFLLTGNARKKPFLITITCHPPIPFHSQEYEPGKATPKKRPSTDGGAESAESVQIARTYYVYSPEVRLEVPFSILDLDDQYLWTPSCTYRFRLETPRERPFLFTECAVHKFLSTARNTSPVRRPREEETRQR